MMKLMKWPCAIKSKGKGDIFLFLILYHKGAQFILNEGQSWKVGTAYLNSQLIHNFTDWKSVPVYT